MTIDEYIFEKFRREGFNVLTDIQQQALPVISRRINCLLVAPTGSGKTEAAVIPVFKILAITKKEQERGELTHENKIRAIYITPLRALNNDVLRRIIKYAESEHLNVEIRHGDSTRIAKRKITNNPPDILITTPESLAVILTNEKILAALKNLEWIIVDEIHELISNKRGTHLSIGLERLEGISVRQVTRIGLSATLGNLREGSAFLAGSKRKCAILSDKSWRNYDIDVEYVKGSLNTVAVYISNYVKSKNITGSILLFTNTRDESEYLGAILKSQKNLEVDVHHGSLSKAVREETEEKLRAGSAGIVVCTSSLELGLDIGSVELVIHYGSPRQVSKMMQRIGRSRHKNEISAKGLIITNFSDDEIEAYAIVRRMKKHSIEEQLMHKDALDVVAHHLVGMALQTKEAVNMDTAIETIRKAYPFRDIGLDDLEGCIIVLERQGIIRYDHETQSFRRRLRAYKYYFDNLSMIPYVLKFDVIDSINKKKIGTLDQQFVGDYGEKGNVFVLKGSQWRVISVDEGRMQVYVEPLFIATINIPYWVGELIPVDYRTAEEVGIIRNQVLRNCVKLSASTPEIFELQNSLGIIPDSENIVVECCSQQNLIVMHSTLGTKVNNTLASLLSTLLSSQLGYVVETRSDPYRIMLKSSVRISRNRIEEAFKDIYDIAPVIIASFTGTYNINWKVWSVAKRFGIINKEAIYDKKAARLIYDRYAKTPVSKESIRELLHDKYDISLTQKILQNFKEGHLKLHWYEISQFSALAKPILDRATKFSAAPLSIEKGIMELVKERLEKTKHRLICIRCGKWERTFQTKDVEDKNLVCPSCRSHLITSTFYSDDDLIKIIMKRLTGGNLCSKENHRFERAWKVASLINNFGKQALIVLSGYGIGADTAARLLRNYVSDEELYRSIYESERQYITTRGFWKD